MELSPEYFWSLIPYEFKLMTKAYRAKFFKSRELMGEAAWFTGISTKADPKKLKYKQWIEQFKDPEEVQRKREESLNRNAQLWDQINKR